ncbi:hypothetical protein MIR68_000941 [Amoeboaphelidium protococcarum]|nr:hypothetical protein MIR68_000941 [Amoeboaphelidium protococcarum]KAI3650894.1 hypothetical protein MP228_004375 [Amoeboaphelidium protococcarum]
MSEGQLKQRIKTQVATEPADQSRVQLPQSRVSGSVFAKLILFTALMLIAPLGTYFYTTKYMFGGNTTYGAIAAVAVTNIVMIGYVILAYSEDSSGNVASQKKD